MKDSSARYARVKSIERIGQPQSACVRAQIAIRAAVDQGHLSVTLWLRDRSEVRELKSHFLWYGFGFVFSEDKAKVTIDWHPPACEVDLQNQLARARRLSGGGE